MLIHPYWATDGVGCRVGPTPEQPTVNVVTSARKNIEAVNRRPSHSFYIENRYETQNSPMKPHETW